MPTLQPCHQPPSQKARGSFWQTTRFQIDLSQPKIMGIVNLTPDSFSDGGTFDGVNSALAHCERLIKDGADILDLGAESSRPGAAPLPLQEELARLIPVLKEAVKFNVPISVDTYKPEVMQAALEAGADIINDIWAFRQAGAREVIAGHHSCGLVMMHMHRDPLTMQLDPLPQTLDVVRKVKNDLLLFAELLTHDSRDENTDSAFKRSLKTRLLIDPGIGFGKTAAQNMQLLSRQRELIDFGYPLLAGWSRKSTLGHICGIKNAQDRLIPSIAAALLALERGASVLRVHDVRETYQAYQIWQNARSS